MVNAKNLEHQLKKIGANYSMWGRAELRELAHVLFDDEVVEHCLNGMYEGGFALLAATDQRVLLIDKKPMSYLTLEDIRFDMISELDYNHRLLNSTLRIFTPNKTLRFTGFNQARLRNLFNHVQQRVMVIRQHYINLNQQQYSMPMQQQQYYGQQQFAPMNNGQQPYLATPQMPMQQQPQQQPSVVQQQFIPQPQQMQQDQPQQQSAQPVYAHHNPQLLSNLTPGQLGISAVRRVAPVISAYTRLPLISRQRRFMGSGS